MRIPDKVAAAIHQLQTEFPKWNFITWNPEVSELPFLYVAKSFPGHFGNPGVCPICTERPVIEETREELLRRNHAEETLKEVRRALEAGEGEHIVTLAQRVKSYERAYLHLLPTIRTLTILYKEIGQ